jgi:hypothetical protein
LSLIIDVSVGAGVSSLWIGLEQAARIIGMIKMIRGDFIFITKLLKGGKG